MQRNVFPRPLQFQHQNHIEEKLIPLYLGVEKSKAITMTAELQSEIEHWGFL